MRLFELTGLEGGDDPLGHSRYGKALALYRETRFVEAAALLTSLDDGPSRWLATRCRTLGATPPVSDWEPITQLDMK